MIHFSGTLSGSPACIGFAAGTGELKGSLVHQVHDVARLLNELDRKDVGDIEKKHRINSDRDVQDDFRRSAEVGRAHDQGNGEGTDKEKRQEDQCDRTIEPASGRGLPLSAVSAIGVLGGDGTPAGPARRQRGNSGRTGFRDSGGTHHKFSSSASSQVLGTAYLSRNLRDSRDDSSDSRDAGFQGRHTHFLSESILLAR